MNTLMYWYGEKGKMHIRTRLNTFSNFCMFIEHENAKIRWRNIFFLFCLQSAEEILDRLRPLVSEHYGVDEFSVSRFSSFV
jgi:hypothetical protein